MSRPTSTLRWHSKRLLANTDLSVKELTERFHFDEPTNLVKFFRRHAGVTPIAFRSGGSR